MKPSLEPHPAKKDRKHLYRVNELASTVGYNTCKNVKIFRVLDVTRMSAQRRDAVCRQTKYGTRDCGHFCRPGVPDWWNLILFDELTRHYKSS